MCIVCDNTIFDDDDDEKNMMTTKPFSLHDSNDSFKRLTFNSFVCIIKFYIFFSRIPVIYFFFFLPGKKFIPHFMMMMMKWNEWGLAVRKKNYGSTRFISYVWDLFSVYVE